jgi:hypothetical protein
MGSTFALGRAVNGIEPASPPPRKAFEINLETVLPQSGRESVENNGHFLCFFSKQPGRVLNAAEDQMYSRADEYRRRGI